MDARRIQSAVVAGASTVVSSTAPYGTGGLGRHLAELVEALRGSGQLAGYLCPTPLPADAGRAGIIVRVPEAVSLAQRLPPVRMSPGWKVRFANRAYDEVASRRLPRAERLLVFNGHSRRHLTSARALGYARVGVVSATAHLAQVARRHDEAWRRNPIERPWSPGLVSIGQAEYAGADEVHVSSRYAWESFVSEGVTEDRLRLFPLTPDDRYRPPRDRRASTFDVVYVGSLSVHKGVPLLVEAVQRLPYDDLRLVLVGGWGSRGMRRYLERACAEDVRILVVPGDPLPHLERAGVCAHPSWSDGFGYAPVEALACGVPVIVSEDTGMKELVEPGRTGWVIPTGDLEALVSALDVAYRGHS